MTPASPAMEREATQLQRAHGRLQRLYEISTLLTKFESAENTVPLVLTRMAETLPLRTVILVLKETRHEARTRAIVWRARAVSEAQLQAAKQNARSRWRYFSRAARAEPFDSEDEGGAEVLGASAAPQRNERQGKNFILLPFAVDHCEVFGAMQVDGAGALDEADLVFVNAVVNQLAVALDRIRTIDAKQAQSEASRQVALVARVQAERREHEAIALQERYQALVDNLDRAFVWIADAVTLRITYASARSEQLCGITVRESEQRSLLELLHPDDKASAQSVLAELVAEKRDRSFDARFVAHDGSVRWFHSGVHLAEGALGAPVFQGVSIDITEAKESEERQRFLAEVSALLAASLDHRKTLATLVRATVPFLADVAIMDELNDDGAVQRFEVVFADPDKQGLAEQVRRNAPRLDSHTPHAQAMRTGEPALFSEAQPESIAQGDAHAALMRECGLESMMIVPLVARQRVLGALTFVAAGSGRRYTTRDLEFAELIGRRAAIAIDNASLYQQAQSAISTRQDLLAVVSHDLRNPLSSIVVGAALLLSRPVSEDRRARSRSGLETIQRAAQQMSRLLNDLVDLASIEAGRLAIKVTWHAVAPLVLEAVGAQSLMATQNGLRLESSIPEDAGYVCCDRGRVLQVFANLIGNALKFTPAGGMIRLIAERQGEETLFSIHDTGPGIPSDELPHVFDRYWQAKKTAHLGSGLGLGITRRLVQAQGGRIWVESRVGAGSTFFFTLPAARPAMRLGDAS